MRGLVLAGGSATRLRPLTYTSAKQLIPIANRPIIGYVLDHLAEAGLTEATLVISPETGQEIRDEVGDGSRYGLDVSYALQDRPGGLAHAILTAADHLGDEPFCMYLGDNLLSHGLGDHVQRFVTSGADASLLLTQVSDPTRFGVADLDGERVVRLVEKPERPPSDLVLVGVYLFTSVIIDAARRIEPSARGELEITDAIQRLIDDGADVRWETVTGYWKDLGTLDDLLAGNALVLSTLTGRIDGTVDASSSCDGTVIIESGATVTDSTLRGPVIIGRDARVTASTIGPGTAIGPGCVIDGSTITHSVLLEGATVVGVRDMTDSLLGRSAVVRHGSATRLMVGDRSEIELG